MRFGLKRDYASQRFYGADDPSRTIEQALKDHAKARAESGLPPSDVAIRLAIDEALGDDRKARTLSELMSDAFDKGLLQ